MTLSDFVTLLMFLLQKKQKERKEEINLALQEGRCWHAIFYRLKKLPKTSGKPAVLDELFFDAESYPICRDLSRIFSHLCITGYVQWSSPDFRKYWLPKDQVFLLQKKFEELGAEEKQFLESIALEIAREEFSVVSA